MRAARWYAAGDIRVEEVSDPNPSPNEALLRVESVGLCGTDVGEYLHGPLELPTRPHSLTGATVPLTLGHEIVAVVERAAADGSGPPTGTRVIPNTQLGCEMCWWCRRGEYGLCRTNAVTGLHIDGGLATFMAARADRLLAVPAELTGDVAVLAEPLSVAVRASQKPPFPLAGTTVLVQGCGTIGLLLVQVLANAGVRRIIATDTSATRLGLAETLGAHIAVAPDQVDQLCATIPEPGVTVAFECSGFPGQAAAALQRVSRRGVVVAVGIHGRPEPVSLLDVILGERMLLGTSGHTWDHDVATALGLLADGRVDVQSLLSATYELDEAPAAFAALADSSAKFLKVAVHP